ncbi:hypothetical protein E4U37_007677 [Claviceps purpurea]|nr:hypothetical protein E4U37_007677 [Claviceps purpurea]
MASTARGQPPQMILIDLESQAPGLTIDSARSAAPPGEKRDDSHRLGEPSLTIDSPRHVQTREANMKVCPAVPEESPKVRAPPPRGKYFRSHIQANPKFLSLNSPDSHQHFPESGSHYIEMASTATGQPPPYDPYRPGEESQACHNPVQGLTIDSARNAGLSSHSNTSKLKHLHGCLIKFARGI